MTNREITAPRLGRELFEMLSVRRGRRAFAAQMNDIQDRVARGLSAFGTEVDALVAQVAQTSASEVQARRGEQRRFEEEQLAVLAAYAQQANAAVDRTKVWADTQLQRMRDNADARVAVAQVDMSAYIDGEQRRITDAALQELKTRYDAVNANRVRACRVDFSVLGLPSFNTSDFGTSSQEYPDLYRVPQGFTLHVGMYGHEALNARASSMGDWEWKVQWCGEARSGVHASTLAWYRQKTAGEGPLLSVQGGESLDATLTTNNFQVLWALWGEGYLIPEDLEDWFQEHWRTRRFVSRFGG